MKQLKFLETKRTPRYSLRKLNVGVASVLLGVTIFGINFTNHSVKAATTESVESFNSSANSRLQQTSAVGNTTAEQTNTQKTTSAKEKVKQSSASKNATANNSTEAATNPQSSPETQGSADTDIKSSTAKSAAKLAATNLVATSDTDRNAAGTVDQNNTNTQKATSAKEKVQQSSASNNAIANNPTESATTLQSAPKTQGSADTDIKSLAAKSAAKLATMNLLAMNLVKNPGTDIKSLAARLAAMSLVAVSNTGASTVDQNNTNTQPAKENQDLANKTNLTSSDNYSSNIYKGTDGKYYKIVTIRGQDYVYRTADIQANGTTSIWYPQKATTAEDTKNNISISKEDLGNGKTRWTVTFFPKMGLQNAGNNSKLHGLVSAKFGIALTNDYQIVDNVDMEVINDTNQKYTYYKFEPGSNSATDITIKNPPAEVDFSFNPKTDVDPNTGLINNSKTLQAYDNRYLQPSYYFTTATSAGSNNLWQTYFFNNGNEVYNNAYDGRTPYLGGDHDFHFNNFRIKNKSGVDGAKEGDLVIYDTRGGVNGVFNSVNFNQAMEFKSHGYASKKIITDLSQYSSYVISFTTQHTDSHEVDLSKGSKNQQFSGISANIYSYQNGYYNMFSSLYGEQRALNTKGDPLKAKDIIPSWDAKKAANAAVDAAVVKQKALITNADNLSDGEKRDLNNQVAAAATNAKKAIDAATTNDGATKAGQDGVAAIEKVVPTSLADAKTALTDAISQGKAAKKSASYYNDAKAEDKSALDNALSKAGEDLNNKALTQATADQDAQAIKDAINGLKGQPTNLDKLNQAISDGTSAQAGSKYANSSDESKGALDQAIKAGQTAKTQSGLTQKEADADASAIETAIKGLSGKETDKTALTDAISKGEAAQKSASYYNDANGDDKSALDKALSQAGEDLNNKALTQATANQDAQAIKDAINGLKGQPTNLDKLNQAISDGTSAQAGSKYANSSDESKGALDQAIKAGQTAKTQSGLTQKEADADASAIETAINGLSGKETSLEDAKKAANKVVEDAVDKQKALITKANNLSDKEKQALNNQVDAAAKTAKDAITAAKTNDVATKAGQDGKTAIEAVTVPTDSDVKKNAKNAIDQAAKTKDDAIDTSNLTAEEKADLKKKVAEEVQKAKSNIDAATKDADVKTAQTNGEKAINAVEIPASVSKTDAINAINTALAAKKGAINGTNLNFPLAKVGLYLENSIV
ncbi:LEA family epithelial adhesin, partial [Lactobacillus sp. UMNPBX6]|uniref:LEA family epithelial adhesin n=1 Tax=Lactobacillus sp. UMNPBX6 TaxID=2042041 RepID=UPI000BEEE55B